jgi:hypothetical protein
MAIKPTCRNARAHDGLWVGTLNNDAVLEPVRVGVPTYRMIGDPTKGATVAA